MILVLSSLSWLLSIDYDESDWSRDSKRIYSLQTLGSYTQWYLSRLDTVLAVESTPDSDAATIVALPITRRSLLASVSLFFSTKTSPYLFGELDAGRILIEQFSFIGYR